MVLAVSFLAAWRATRRVSADRVARAARRTSPIVELAARGGLRPTATNGLRMALQPGTGTTAVPVRSAFAGAAFGIAGIVAVLVFGASLSHLVATPRLSGWTWDLKTEVLTKPGSFCADANDFGIARTKGVEAVAAVCVRQRRGRRPRRRRMGTRGACAATIAPTIVSGRLPATPGEIALGAVTMRKIHKHIGDSVNVALNDKARTYEVVGQVALPTIDEPQPLADGALMTEAGMSAIGETGENETHYLLIRTAPGASRAPIDARIKELDKLAVASGDSRRRRDQRPDHARRGQPPAADRLVPGHARRAARDAGAARGRPRARHVGAAPAAGARAAQDDGLRPPATERARSRGRRRRSRSSG